MLPETSPFGYLCASCVRERVWGCAGECVQTRVGMREPECIGVCTWVCENRWERMSAGGHRVDPRKALSFPNFRSVAPVLCLSVWRCRRAGLSHTCLGRFWCRRVCLEPRWPRVPLMNLFRVTQSRTNLTSPVGAKQSLENISQRSNSHDSRGWSCRLKWSPIPNQTPLAFGPHGPVSRKPTWPPRWWESCPVWGKCSGGLQGTCLKESCPVHPAGSDYVPGVPVSRRALLTSHWGTIERPNQVKEKWKWWFYA